MIRQMAWLSQPGDSEKILHLRMARGDPWRPYTNFSKLTIPDHMTINSRGFSTFQKLLCDGWQIIASDTALSQLSDFDNG